MYLSGKKAFPVQKAIPRHFKFVYREALEEPADAHAVFECCAGRNCGKKSAASGIYKFLQPEQRHRALYIHRANFQIIDKDLIE